MGGIIVPPPWGIPCSRASSPLPLFTPFTNLRLTALFPKPTGRSLDYTTEAHTSYLRVVGLHV